MHEKREDVVQTLVVLGATGNQGRAVLEHFAKHSFGFSLRGITRNSQSKVAQELQRMGVDMVEADLEDLDSLCEAFSGATHIFATTDSNQNIFHAIQHPEVLEEGQTPRQFAREKELQQGKNIAEAASTTNSLQRVSPKRITV